MAYVESFYLEPEAHQAPDLNHHIEEAPQVANLHELNELQSDVALNNTKPSPVSDYCGFESFDIPPIYRAQLRAAKKNNILEAENVGKSVYAYGTSEVEQHDHKVNENQKIVKQQLNTVTNKPQSIEYYVPGFSPPPQHENEEIQKRIDFSLPKIQPIEATENVFNLAGKHEASQYILMENENPNEVATSRKSEMESLISYTASDATSTMATTVSSCLTATLGPAYGCIPITKSSSRSFEDKYKGLSAFRPVTKSIESHYAMPELN